MNRPLELLRDAAHDEWSDPVETAKRAAQGLLQLVDGSWHTTGLEAARMLRRTVDALRRQLGPEHPVVVHYAAILAALDDATAAPPRRSP